MKDIFRQIGFGCIAVILLSSLPNMDNLKFWEADDAPEISEIIEAAETAMMPEEIFFDDWQVTGHKKNGDFWQEMGYIIIPSDEISAPADEKWWEDGKKSKHHSVDISATGPMPAEPVPAITETKVEKLVFDKLAEAPAIPMVSAPATVKGGIVPTPPADLKDNRKASEDSGAPEWMDYPESSGKFNLGSLPPESSGTPPWMDPVDSLDDKRTTAGKHPEWMKPTLEYLPTRSWTA